MSAATQVAVSVVGNDRPGIVAGVTEVLFELGCNLEDVTSTILRNHFAMLLIVLTPEGVSAGDLENKLAPVAERLHLAVSARAIEVAPAGDVVPTHMVSVYGSDRPGIVFRVAGLLAEKGVNITDLTSRLIGEDDAPVYALMLEVVAPEGSDVTAWLEGLREDSELDVTVQAVETDVL